MPAEDGERERNAFVPDLRESHHERRECAHLDRIEPAEPERVIDVIVNRIRPSTCSYAPTQRISSRVIGSFGSQTPAPRTGTPVRITNMSDVATMAGAIRLIKPTTPWIACTSP
jgi:hypothetical protein